MANRTLGLALVTCVAFSLPVLAAVSVSGPFVDESTGGDWRGTYGECFFLLPDPPISMARDAVGPDWTNQDLKQYRYNNCYGGAIFSVDPAKSSVQWRIHRNNVDDPTAGAFATALEAIPGSSQWNPCINQFRNASFSNRSFDYDPLTVDLRLNVKGNIEVAYYFTSAAGKCREQDFRLLVDGVEKASGTIGDFAAGKYVIFEVIGLQKSPGGTLITLEAQDAAGEAACADGSTPSRNVHVSGVFLSSLDQGPGSCDQNSGNGTGF